MLDYIVNYLKECMTYPQGIAEIVICVFVLIFLVCWLFIIGIDHIKARYVYRKLRNKYKSKYIVAARISSEFCGIEPVYDCYIIAADNKLIIVRDDFLQESEISVAYEKIKNYAYVRYRYPMIFHRRYNYYPILLLIVGAKTCEMILESGRIRFVTYSGNYALRFNFMASLRGNFFKYLTNRLGE